MISLFLHYIFTNGKYWESNWILPSFLSVQSETKDSEKPDGLRFVQANGNGGFRGMGSHRTVAGAARCNPQVVSPSLVQGGLEGKRAALLGQPLIEWAEQDSNLRPLLCK